MAMLSISFDDVYLTMSNILGFSLCEADIEMDASIRWKQWLHWLLFVYVVSNH